MDQKSYLVLTAVIVIPLAMSFLFIRKGPKQPVQLQMNAGDRKNKALTPEPTAQSKPVRPQKQQGQPPPRQATQQKHQQQSKYDSKLEQDFDTSPGEKSLNVLFNWNGHSWDAYEVLGIPAGSSREAVQTAYQKAMTQGDSDSQPFYKAAFDAIGKASGSRG